MTPNELLRQIRRIDVYVAAQTAIENTTSALINIQQEQLFAGIRPDGKEVTPSYAPRTIKIKQKKGQPTDRVTRKDTGSYYAGIKVDVGGDKFTVYSTDPKNESLDKKYGGIALADAYKPPYIRILKPELIKVIKLQMNA